MRWPQPGVKNLQCGLPNSVIDLFEFEIHHLGTNFMNQIITFISLTHVVAGVVSLVAAPIALMVLKGGSAHRLAGQFFFWSMTWIFISAIILSVYKSIPFLLMIAVFSYYSVVIAYRSLYQKQLYRGKGITWFDWMALVISGSFNLGFVAWGVFQAVQGRQGFISYLAVGFGIGGLIIVTTQLKSFVKHPTDKNHWLFAHIGNMTGGFIASVTAFSANVLTFLPGVIQWIWPSFVGIPLIYFWIKSYRRKLSNNVPLSDLVVLKR